MGLISSLGLGGGAKSPDAQSAGFNRWEKQGKIGLNRTLDRSGMTYSDRKKVKGIIHPRLAGGRKLSHDQIIKEIKKEFGYNLGKRVEKAFTPKMKQELQKPSLHEQAEIKKKAEKKKKVNIFLGLKSSKEAEAYKKTKGALEEGLGFGWQSGQEQQSDQNKGPGLDKRPEFQGIGSSTNKPASPPPDTIPKTPPPSIPLSR